MAGRHPYRTAEPRDADAEGPQRDRELLVLAVIVLGFWAMLRIALAPFAPTPEGEIAVAALVLTLCVRQLVLDGACVVSPPQPKD